MHRFLPWLLVLFIISCSNPPKENNSNTDPQKKLPTKIQIFTSGFKPKWVDEKERVGIYMNQQVLFFSTSLEEKTLEIIKTKIDTLQEPQALKSFQLFAASQINGILEKEPKYDEKITLEIKNKIDHFKFSKENPASVKKIAFWWEHYTEPKIEKEQVAGWTPPLIKYSIRYIFVYENYKNIRNQLLISVKKDLLQVPNSGQIIDNLLKKLSDADQFEETEN